MVPLYHLNDLGGHCSVYVINKEMPFHANRNM